MARSHADGRNPTSVALIILPMLYNGFKNKSQTDFWQICEPSTILCLTCFIHLEFVHQIAAKHRLHP